MTLRGLRGIDPALGRYDFDGNCVRVVDRDSHNVRHLGDWRRGKVRPLNASYQRSFSLGVYRYVERKDGGLKRGKVVRRVHGSFGTGDHAPERAFEEAERVCADLERKGV